MTRIEVKPAAFDKHGNAYDYCVTIDGVEVHPMAEGFSITFPDGHVPIVTMQFWADELQADLPDALLEAVAVTPPNVDGALDGADLIKAIRHEQQRRGRPTTV